MKKLVIILIFILLPASASALTPDQFNLTEGDVISASGDPDIYIVNEHGYKRLFLNPEIFNFYGHLGGFENVREIRPFERDSFQTTTYFQNCESGIPAIYAVEVTGEDIATLHWLDVSGEEALAADPNFFKKVFCINNNEFKWYSLGIKYTSMDQVPNYTREGAASLQIPFEIGDMYDASNKSLGELSYAGSYVIIPFGGHHFDYWTPGTVSSWHIELVPGTILRAPVAGVVKVGLNDPPEEGPEGQDYEMHIGPTGDVTDYWVEFDHVVDLRVQTGDYVEVGDPLARAAPASIRHGGSQGENPVEEVEWAVKIPGNAYEGGAAVCPLRYLSEADKQKIYKALDVMAEQGFNSGDDPCFVEEL
ncbi:MAG: hypothetical protein R3251_00920 [Candidatus Spechtbacterales bacterium]|nr:hypothetical protein [Candidatus Spechtbacterales bacterium]